MAYRTLNADQRKIARSWLHDVFAQIGATPNKRPAGTAPFMDEDGRYKGTLDNACTKVTNEMFDPQFANLDGALRTLARFHFMPESHMTTDWNHSVKKRDTVLASYIADFCAQEKWYWDDSIKSTYEMDEFKKTLLGKALYDFGCFTSQPDVVARASRSSTSSVGTTSSTSAGGTAPKNDYKSTGPQSGNVRDIISTPGQKEIITGNYLFGIEGTNTKAAKVGAFAHIKPLSTAGAAGNTNKVFLGSSNGYTDCKVYLPDTVSADAFLQKCVANCPSTITNLHVVRKNPDKNGYFLVGTEYGPVYIAAQKLNEAIEPETEILEGIEEFIKVADSFDANLHRYN